MGRKKYMSTVKKLPPQTKGLRPKKYTSVIRREISDGLLTEGVLAKGNKIKYLHLMVDNVYSKIFIEFIDKYFDMEDHHFLIWGWDEDGLKNIDIKKYNNVEQKGFYSTLRYCDISEKIFIHYLTDEKAAVVNSYHKPEKFHWIFWGYDFYSKSGLDVYGPVTKRFLKSIGLEEQPYHPALIRDFARAISRIPYIMHYIRGDYKIIKRYYNTGARLLPFFYPNSVNYPELDNIGEYENPDLYLKDKYKYVIQLGNSATQSNNHAEVLYYLKELNSTEFCVIVPLSYGIPIYRDHLIELGKSLLGDQFIPITEFHDAKDYFYLLNQVDIAIMNHRIQQGVGNTLGLLYLEKKIYMNKETTTFSFLKELGAEIFTIDSLANTKLEDMAYMKEEDKLANKTLVKTYFNEENAKENIRRILNMD